MCWGLMRYSRYVGGVRGECKVFSFGKIYYELWEVVCVNLERRNRFYFDIMFYVIYIIEEWEWGWCDYEFLFSVYKFN